MDKEMLEWLEYFVDRYNLNEVLSALGYICSEKSAHIAENWQDTRLAKMWMGYAQRIDMTVSAIQREQVKNSA